LALERRELVLIILERHLQAEVAQMRRSAVHEGGWEEVSLWWEVGPGPGRWG
jgi:hypothetical protein